MSKENTFYTIASFDYPADVQILKGKLESEGVPVFLKDENTLNSDPLISYAIGGVKLQVYTKHKEKALKIYDAIRAYALDDEGNPIVCPNCKAKKSELYYHRKGIFLKLFPFFESRKYKCLQCGIITKSN
ncbi:DUF2007 domain-containing protein [Maribacter sp. HTCC2170]|uniref:DUF2007 domain-containing protein n=1 Tax=Maribacter sp. (strain HTCC2170 / KCCM 42371) TaxID=313603 RepID=UPI00006B3AFE|nr:DUF2007 domain-containing protein [Maribacter sp. HTCC2170]EAQ99767.1 hypothetical protein FB2170_07424 [Maribacter sp. HTCC2170]